MEQKTISLALPEIKTKDDLIKLFPKNIADINYLKNEAIEQTTKSLNNLYSISEDSRNFENTILAYDRIQANFSYKESLIYVMTMVNPDKEIRDVAKKAILELQEFSIDNFGQNKKLYTILKEYYENVKKCNIKLSKSQEYFIEETLKGYKKSGIEKSDQVRNKIKEIAQNISSLSLEFSKNINSNNRNIKVKIEDLKGLDKEFIDSLNKIEENSQTYYILTVDYPTYFKVIEECSIEKTRQSLWKEFNLRGYPENKDILNKIINLRDELSKLLDFNSYADMDLDDEMAKNPDNVIKFLKTIENKAKEKIKKEINILKDNLPTFVRSINNKFNPWDIAYIINEYKKNNLSLDENLISQYFPLENTLKQLFNIYQQFFGLKFEEIDIENNLWHKDLKVSKVYKQDKFIGFLILDLFPRENKFTHACQVSLIPSVKDNKNNIICPAVVLVIANFTKPTNNKPALLRRKEVTTFFHECGHAIHSLLGTTKLAAFSGTSVKRDFVEMPSQMLEEWMTEKDILKLISNHYKTNEHLPDNIIENIKKNKNLFLGTFLLGQISYALFSLNIFNSGINKDIDKIWKDSHKSLENILYKTSEYGYCSFGHITDYASKYYGYLWSSIFAKDLFDTIKKHGLLNNQIGELYTKKVLSKGGSKDPNELLKDFLSREPSTETFFKELE